jgi:alpha-amylase
VFGVHFHQPVGNFDHVFEAHVRDVYRPFLERLVERDFFPIALHVSGPLLEWLEAHEPQLVDRIGSLAADGKAELLLSGFYEPVLIALPRPDRIEQVAWMRAAIQRRFGSKTEGVWLTERVWEPDLAADLAQAGIRYALVDDRHFLVTGFAPERLHAPFWTESDGHRLALLPMHERLRYLIPFRPPADTVAYLRELRAAGHGLAVLADDGEKFGGWPGTKEWVYDRGWLREFLDAMHAVMATGEVRLTTPAAALDEVPSGGLAYLPTASYREMETWALPPAAAWRLARLEQDLGAERVAGPDGALLRGSHWRHFLVRYPEANRMHKKMHALSALCRARGDPPTARRAIGRAQCNDAYWHGVFGGLYLPHLRRAVWGNLAAAEAELRTGEPLAAETLDFDADGHAEIWVHSAAFSALVSPARGGAVEEFTRFSRGVNFGDVLTRRREVYHVSAQDGGATGTHDIETGPRLDALPPEDFDDRALFVDRVLGADVSFEGYARGDYRPVRSWARRSLEAVIERTPEAIVIRCGGVDGLVEKELRFTGAGGLTVRWRWDASAFESDTWFAPEISVAEAVELRCAPSAEVWSFPIATVSKSERGFDQTTQGHSHTPRWPIAAGAARVDLPGD